MQFEIEDNPNCQESPFQVFPEAGAGREVAQVRLEENGEEKTFSICGVEPPGIFIPAIAIKIEDSGGGVAHLIAGGGWGIRLKPHAPDEPWNLKNPNQKGLPYIVLASEKDIL